MIKKPKSSPRKVVKKSKVKKDETEDLRDLIVEGMQEKKAKEIVCIDLRNIKNAVTDFFVICHADSKAHIDAIAKSVEEFVYKSNNEEPFHREGKNNSEWILLDYLNVVVHIFRQEQREFYGIERLWADAEIKRIVSNY
ncbi:MAG: ribosome silencing factor [Bacteroidetes bacterium]|nr:ribosome silencing factor [Bacteroidota bacterium]